jgi:hypothetical protein
MGPLSRRNDGSRPTQWVRPPTARAFTPVGVRAGTGGPHSTPQGAGRLTLRPRRLPPTEHEPVVGWSARGTTNPNQQRRRRRRCSWCRFGAPLGVARSSRQGVASAPLVRLGSPADSPADGKRPAPPLSRCGPPLLEARPAPSPGGVRGYRFRVYPTRALPMRLVQARSHFWGQRTTRTPGEDAGRRGSCRSGQPVGSIRAGDRCGPRSTAPHPAD